MQKNNLLRFVVFSVVGFCVLAETRAEEASVVSENDPLLRAWQQQNVGGPVPELVAKEGGGTRIVWSGNVSVEGYVNSVSSAAGNVMTPFRGGRFARSVVQSDLRGTGEDGQTSFFQLGWTSTNDRAVLSQYPQQINSLQIGRNGERYLLALGDVAPNYSSLGTTLGARGVIGQVKLGAATVSAFTGLVAQSWEMLGGQVPRNQFLRDVYGGKVEYQLWPALKVYATAQGGADRPGSLPAGASYNLPMKLRSSSGGFQFQEGAFQVSGEYAHGGSEAEGMARQSGNAMIVDASWRLEQWNWRGGYHEIDPGYASLSGMLQPGITETYLNADWTAANWLTLGADLRNSKNRTLETLYAPATTSHTDAGSLRANMNFGPNLPGWGSSLQQSRSTQRDPLDQITRNRQTSASLNFSSPRVSASVGYGAGTTHSEAYPDYDSTSSSWQFNFGRNYSDATDQSASTWSLGLNFNGALQKQAMANGSASNNFNYGLSINAQREGLGSLQLTYSEGLASQPYGMPEMKQRGLQMDATRPLWNNAAIKLYVRDNERNIGMPDQETRESVSGVQLTSPF